MGTAANGPIKDQQKPNRHGGVLVLFAIAIVLTWVGYPQIKAEHARLAKINKGRLFQREFQPKLKADPRFERIGVVVSTGGNTLVMGEVDSAQTYVELKRLALSCERKDEVHLTISFPDSVPGAEELIAFTHSEMLPPGD